MNSCEKTCARYLRTTECQKTNQNRWLDFTDFYCLLDKNGQLSEEGRATIEKWKDYFGDPLKEMSFAMYMID